MSQSSRIIFFGNERLSSGFDPHGAPTLQKLISAGYDIAAVVASDHAATSRSKRSLGVKEVAEAHNIPVLLPANPIDILDQLLSLKADVGVLVAYGRIIPESIISAFPEGIVNIHPSLLPKYRGSTPIEQAILDGATQTGVSLMQLVKQMDAGPIFAQTKVALLGNETKTELTERLLQLGGDLLLQHLPAIIDGSLTPKPQEESAATYTKLFTKSNSQLDQNKSAEVLEREVRAYADWPKSRVTLFGQQVVITSARVAANDSSGQLVLNCGHNTFLEITQLVAPSGRTMSGADFVRGYKK